MDHSDQERPQRQARRVAVLMRRQPVIDFAEVRVSVHVCHA